MCLLNGVFTSKNIESWKNATISAFLDDVPMVQPEANMDHIFLLVIPAQFYWLNVFNVSLITFIKKKYHRF